MTYAEVTDVQARMTRTLTADERLICQTLLEDAAVKIDAIASGATNEAKKVVSCEMVRRVLGDGQPTGIPIGATQGSMSGLGYAQSWTMTGGGSSGQMYISKDDRRTLGLGKQIGSHSPIEDVTEVPTWWG